MVVVGDDVGEGLDMFVIDDGIGKFEASKGGKCKVIKNVRDGIVVEMIADDNFEGLNKGRGDVFKKLGVKGKGIDTNITKFDAQVFESRGLLDEAYDNIMRGTCGIIGKVASKCDKFTKKG